MFGRRDLDGLPPLGNPWHSETVVPNYFDERIAKSYDARWPEVVDPAVVESIVDFLAPLADSAPALELAIGTGRIALPLSRRGIPVHGIELSVAMVDEMRTKPGSEKIEVTIGDMAQIRVDKTFRLVYLVANSIANLTTQDAQVACFVNAAQHLAPGGSFVIELYVPALRRLPPGQTIVPFTLTPTHLGFEEYDVANQIAFSHHYWQLDGQWDTLSAPFRYVWPSELDLMARIADLSLRERWANWDRDAFTSDSAKHVSVWEKNAASP
jgi:SAM-dependent methyltransferase